MQGLNSPSRSYRASSEIVAIRQSFSTSAFSRAGISLSVELRGLPRTRLACAANRLAVLWFKTGRVKLRQGGTACAPSLPSRFSSWETVWCFLRTKNSSQPKITPLQMGKRSSLPSALYHSKFQAMLRFMCWSAAFGPLALRGQKAAAPNLLQDLLQACARLKSFTFL